MWLADRISLAKIIEMQVNIQAFRNEEIYLLTISMNQMFSRCYNTKYPSISVGFAFGPVPAVINTVTIAVVIKQQLLTFLLNASHECHLWGRKCVCYQRCFPCLQLTMTDKIIY